jgi:hypothetical protein
MSDWRDEWLNGFMAGFFTAFLICVGLVLVFRP